METALLPSTFVHVFKNGEVAALFHSLKIKVAYIQKSHYNIITCFDTRSPVYLSSLDQDELELAQQLLELEMLVVPDTDEEKCLEDICYEYTGQPDIALMYLILTETCNLACKYCFIKNAFPENREAGMMTTSTVQAAVNLFAKHVHVCDEPQHKPSIIFYGGEPTINWQVFTEAVLYIEQKIQDGSLPSKTEMSMITNGTLLDVDKITFIRDHNVGLSISIDGLNENSDARVFAGGQFSVDRVIENYKITKEMMPVSVSCTVTPINVGNLRDVTQWLCENKVLSVGFNILMDVPSQPPVSDHLVRQISEELTRSFGVFRSHEIYEDRIGRKVRVFLNRPFTPMTVEATGDSL